MLATMRLHWRDLNLGQWKDAVLNDEKWGRGVKDVILNLKLIESLECPLCQKKSSARKNLNRHLRGFLCDIKNDLINVIWPGHHSLPGQPGHHSSQLREDLLDHHSDSESVPQDDRVNTLMTKVFGCRFNPGAPHKQGQGNSNFCLRLVAGDATIEDREHILQIAKLLPSSDTFPHVFPSFLQEFDSPSSEDLLLLSDGEKRILKLFKAWLERERTGLGKSTIEQYLSYMVYRRDSFFKAVKLHTPEGYSIEY